MGLVPLLEEVHSAFDLAQVIRSTVFHDLFLGLENASLSGDGKAYLDMLGYVGDLLSKKFRYRTHLLLSLFSFLIY